MMKTFERTVYKKTDDESFVDFAKRIIFSAYGEDQYADRFSNDKCEKMAEILAQKNQARIQDLGIFDLMNDIRHGD